MITVDGGHQPLGVYVDTSSNVYYTANNQIFWKKRTGTGPVVIAGTGIMGSDGDGYAATSAL